MAKRVIGVARETLCFNTNLSAVSDDTGQDKG